MASPIVYLHQAGLGARSASLARGALLFAVPPNTTSGFGSRRLRGSLGRGVRELRDVILGVAVRFLAV